jgi:hypothetical protein
MKVLKLMSVIVAIAILAACSQGVTPTNLEIPEGDISSQASSWQKLGGAIDASINKSPLQVIMLLDRTEKPVVASLEDDNKAIIKCIFKRGRVQPGRISPPAWWCQKVATIDPLTFRLT